MYAKIIGLGLIASLLAIDASHDWLRHAPVDATPRMLLVPPAVGDWQQTAQWLNPGDMGQYQEYAQYMHDGLLVTLSFDHNRLSAHNALNCFLVKGEQLEASTVRSLKTLDGNTRFNLARFDGGTSMSMVAASQCLVQGCIENPPAPSWADVGRISFWKEILFKPHYSAIPINISITSGPTQPQQQSYSAMEQGLVNFIANLDTNPIRRQAQIEGEAGK